FAVILTDRSGGTRIFLTKWNVSDAIIDPAGTKIVYLTGFGPDGPARLSVIDVKSGIETEATEGFAISNPALTMDGSTIFFTDFDNGSQRTQLFAIGIEGSNRRRITHEANGVQIPIVSGDGRVAYAPGTPLLRIEVASGAVTEILPATRIGTTAYRVFQPPTDIAAVGSVVDLWGPNLQAANGLTFCGRPLPIQLVQLHLRFQVPWDLPDGLCQVIATSNSPFEYGVNLNVRQYDPQYVNP